jgi:hypothetical protein
MNRTIHPCNRGIAVLLAALLPSLTMPPFTYASSHMDAPLITLDPAANTTDVYAFRSASGGAQYLTAALAVYPFEEPGIGPNKYNFDDNVLYAIHLALGKDVAGGRTTISYEFEFTTRYKNGGTILQSYLGVINSVDDAAQNLTQTYTITKWDRRTDARAILGRGVVPPNNQGIATPKYNGGDNGENSAKGGVATAAELDPYTAQSIATLSQGYRAFAGQRDDGFYGDIQSIFDLLQLRSPGKDAQGGFNVHTIVLNIPLADLGGELQTVGVYATTSRRSVSVLRDSEEPKANGKWVQVGRQGNPLFCEAFVAIADKDKYNRSSPTDDAQFAKYATTPELAHLINAIVFAGNGPAPESNRTDLAGIFIPDLIKIDLSTGPCRLAGGGASHPTNPDDSGFSRLGIFGGDTLVSQIQAGFGGGTVPGGWPNGRRFGDDVVDIGVTAVISDLRGPLVIHVADGIDGVSANDMPYNKVFPYATTPQNGRNHSHP